MDKSPIKKLCSEHLCNLINILKPSATPLPLKFFTLSAVTDAEASYSVVGYSIEFEKRQIRKTSTSVHMEYNDIIMLAIYVGEAIGGVIVNSRCYSKWRR